MPGQSKIRLSLIVSMAMLVIGLATVPGIFYFQRPICGIEQWPPDISPALAIGLIPAGLIGLLNGILITYRQPGNRIGWLCSITGFIGLLATLASRYALCGVYGAQALPGVAVIAWISYLITPLVIALVFWQVPFWFPPGDFLSTAWRRFAIGSWVPLLVALGLIGVLPGNMTGNGIGLYFPINNPFGFNYPASVSLRIMLPRVIIILLLSISIAANLSLVQRWGRARGDERQQIKWLAFFVVVVVSIFVGVEVFAVFLTPSLLTSAFYRIAFYTAWIGYPVVIGLSVLKYRLYDVDIVIRRTLLYAGLSLVLAIIYFASVTILQSIFSDLSRQRSPIVVVVSTLLIAALFNPLRRRLQFFIDRRFYRSKYDAARTLERFSTSVRNEVELQTMLSHLETVIDETMQPDIVDIWLAKNPVKSK